MYNNEQEDRTIYTVVMNHEEQYSIWPASRDLPLGWKEVGKQGLKDICLSYIEEVWTDMRPLSLRKKMAEIASQEPQRETLQPEIETPAEPYKDPLIQKLIEGNHPIFASRAENSVERFKESIDRGYVLLKFINTQGGTELGVRLNTDTTDLSKADFNQAQGTVHLEGRLKLNYTEVECIADIDLETLEGMGHLKVV